MKTISKITLTLIFLSGLFVSNAQKMSYGLHAGTNFAVQSPIGDYYNNNDILTGLHAGLFTKFQFSEKFSLQGEINYDQQGSKSSDVSNHYDYINIPVLLNYSLGKSDRTPLRFNLYAGPFAGYLLKAESKTDNAEINETTDLTDNTNKATVGVVTGFGLRYPVNNSNIMFDLRLGLGLAPYDKNDYQPKNKYIGISLGYEF